MSDGCRACETRTASGLDGECPACANERARALREQERARGKAREPKCTTLDHAMAVVKSAPGEVGQDAVAAHVQRFLRDAYEQGKRDGSALARETLLRSELAFYEGNAARSAGSANEVRNELNATLEALGKDRVWPPK